jgi:hypothetical protein
MSEQSTTLRILASDAILEVTFTGMLSPDQYSQLVEAVKAAKTAHEHVDAFSLLADQWQVGVSVRRVKV